MYQMTQSETIIMRQKKNCGTKVAQIWIFKDKCAPEILLRHIFVIPPGFKPGTF